MNSTTLRKRKRLKIPEPKFTVDQICNEIRDLHKGRMLLVKIRNKQDNAIGAYVRLALGFNPAKDPETDQSVQSKAEQNKITTRAAEIVKLVKNGKSHEVDDVPAHVCDAVSSAILANGPLLVEEKSYDDKIADYVRRLPIWEWVKDQHGVGEGIIGRIIGEAGNLHNYSSVRKLRKRMGLCPYNGHMGSTWIRIRKPYDLPALTKEQWTDYGYSPRRRSTMHQLTMGAGDYGWPKKSPWRKDYERAKANFLARRPEEPTKTKKKKGEKKEKEKKNTIYSPGHASRHGQLVAEQVFLKDLWCAWHKT